MSSMAIDAVISWVDGSDPCYQRKLRSFCAEQGIDHNQAVEPTRIQQSNEIHYCLHALERFAPWIRTIYMVTNQQTPPTVAALQGTPFGDKIKIIDQNDLLLESGITTPVFNSLSIEWLMWRIKGLSNQFLYLNDDFFIIRPVTPEDFFRNHRLVLRGEWKTQSDQKWLFKMKQRLLGRLRTLQPQSKTNPHRTWQENSAQLAGWTKRFYLLPHAPFPLLKETFDACIAREPQWLMEHAHYPFRHPDQISSIPLMVHLDIKQHRVVYDSSAQTVMVNGATHALNKIKSRLKSAHENSNVLFVCMQSLDQAPPATQRYMIDWLQQHI